MMAKPLADLGHRVYREFIETSLVAEIKYIDNKVSGPAPGELNSTPQPLEVAMGWEEGGS